MFGRASSRAFLCILACWQLAARAVGVTGIRSHLFIGSHWYAWYGNEERPRGKETRTYPTGIQLPEATLLLGFNHSRCRVDPCGSICACHAGDIPACSRICPCHLADALGSSYEPLGVRWGCVPIAFNGVALLLSRSIPDAGTGCDSPKTASARNQG